MNFKIHIFKNKQFVQTFSIQEGQILSIGRQDCGATLGLEDAKISRQHANIFAESGKLFIQDTGSSNGTYIGQTRLEVQKNYALADGQVIWFSPEYFIMIELLADHSGKTIIENQRESNSSSQKMPQSLSKDKKIGIGVVGFVLAFGLFYYLYLGEYLAYKKVCDFPTRNNWKNYYRDYGTRGRYAEHVKFIEIDHEPDIRLVRDFMKAYSASSYFSQVLKIKDKLWESEIEKYDKQVAGQKSTKKSVIFFKQLLLHLKNQNQEFVYVRFDSKTQLKNYEQYPQNIRYKLEYAGFVDKNLPMIALKENFESENIKGLEYLIIDGVQTSFSKIFTADFIKVKNYESPEENSPMIIDIDYVIKNQSISDAPEYPNIWTYTKNQQPTAHLLGINIDFDFNSKVPKTEAVYAFKTHSEPADSFKDIEDISDGYKLMSKSVFEDYANTITENFGLQSSY
ncbi:MAG: FHA domain-containing protein [Bacteroidetes bacterium]|nr:MAG: FHA domain-containing protein [Bacteroidota bacterium]